MEKEGSRILLVDGEGSEQSLRRALTSACYVVYHASSGEEALRKAQLVRPDLMLLDVCLAAIDGRDVICRLRKWAFTPVIVISAGNEESNTITLLDTGADDYVTKPFALGELMARIRVRLRGVCAAQSEMFVMDDLSVDFDRREVVVNKAEVKLTPTEYALLKVLIHHNGKVRTHHQLVREVWGSVQYQDSVHLLHATLSNLRRKLRSEVRTGYIMTERAVGFRMRTDRLRPAPVAAGS